MNELKKQGTKHIFVDPRKTQTATIADLWLQIRPGTDTALLMSMINVIINEELYDKDFVKNWCYGFDKVAERAREYPPDKMAEVTWIAPETIKEAARLFAQNKPAIISSGMGIEHHSDATTTLHAILILEAITGNIDIPGGVYLSGPGEAIQVPELELTEMLSPEQKQKQLGGDRFKLSGYQGYDLIAEAAQRVWGKAPLQHGSVTNAHAPSLYRAMLTGEPYPVRACITLQSNPMLTQGNVKLVYQALKTLDLYVVIDYWLTPSAELADYVLPAAPWPERPNLSIEFDAYTNTVFGGEQALPSEMPGQYQHKHDYDIMRALGTRLGQSKYWPWENMEESYDHQLKPLGVTHKEFMAQGGYHIPAAKYQKYETIGFGTPTGKVELSSTILEKLGYDPLPYYQESFENPISTPQVAKEYPLMLITGGRFLPVWHSEHRQIDAIRKKHPDPILQVNPETASKLDIKDGDWAWIETPRGRIRQKCMLFDGIDPRVVHCEHAWWFPELPGEEPWLHGVWESNVNILTEDDPEVCDNIFGEWPLKTALCKVYKMKQY